MDGALFISLVVERSCSTYVVSQISIDLLSLIGTSNEQYSSGIIWKNLDSWSGHDDSLEEGGGGVAQSEQKPLFVETAPYSGRYTGL